MYKQDVYYKGGAKPTKINDFVWEIRYYREKKIPEGHGTQVLRLKMRGPLIGYFALNDPIRIEPSSSNNMVTIRNLKTNQYDTGEILKK